MRNSTSTIAAALMFALPLVCVTTVAVAAEQSPHLNLAAISRELSDHPDDTVLNFLSGVAYEQTTTNSSEARQLARVGYLMALRQDDGFWRASYQLGLMALEDRDSQAAQRFLLMAATKAPGEARIYYALARAAYCAGDIDLAAAALARAEELHQSDSEDDRLTVALVSAATGNSTRLGTTLPQLSSPLREGVENRLAVPREAFIQQQPSPPAGTSQLADSQMAVVDVIVIRRSESTGTNSGINLLDTLSLQLGGNLINRNWAKSTDQIDPTLSTSTISQTSSLELTIPTVTYSLNLANARGNSSRIEARPTLLIFDETEAKVFDGGTLTFATDGQLSSSSETREVGLSLSVKPKFLSNDKVNLAVTVTLETFVPSAPAGTFRQAIQTAKSSTVVAANVQFGQTMLVSGGSSTTVTRGSSKTPLASDIPLLGKLFSAKSKSRQDSELIVLLSLRRVPGQSVFNESDVEQRLTAGLRQKVFPNLKLADLLALETRQMFYRMENPARSATEAYIAPMLSKTTFARLIRRN